MVVVGFIRARSGGLRRGCPVVVGYISRWVHSGPRSMSLGSFRRTLRIVGVVPMRRRVYSGSLGSFPRALGVVVFILVRLVGVDWVAPWGSFG